MELYIPIEEAKTINLITNRKVALSTDTVEELKQDDQIVISEKTLLEALEQDIENQDVTNTFVKKLLKVIAEDEDLQREIITVGMDLATKCTEDPERAVFVAAKKLWASCTRGY